MGGYPASQIVVKKVEHQLYTGGIRGNELSKAIRMLFPENSPLVTKSSNCI